MQVLLLPPLLWLLRSRLGLSSLKRTENLKEGKTV
jgi:hypothetical protein